MGCITSAPRLKNGGRRYGAPRASDAEIRDRIECSPATVSLQIGTTQLRYAYLSQRGYYPDALNKPNQDCFLVCRNFMRDPNRALFSVFDGHGREGDLCAQYARDLLVEKLGEHLKGKITESDIKQGITRGFVELNEQLHANSAIDDTLSGTTAISIIFFGDTMYVANVGDSRAIVAQKVGDGSNSKVQAFPLSDDQTPYRKDERERVKKCGARVLSMDQIAGIEPIHENWGDFKLGEDIDEGGDPPRIWSKYGEYPGTAFTRSLGDSIAEELGVYAVPEITVRSIAANDAFIVIASDGVFEFLTNQNTADIIKQYADPLEACHAVVQEAYELWLQYEVRTDDITLIAMYVDSTGTVAGAAAQDAARAPSPADPAHTLHTSRPVRSPRGKRPASHKTAQPIMFDFEEMKIAKTPHEMASILQVMESNFLFRGLDEEKKRAIAEIMTRVQVKAGDWVIRQGDEGDRFYIAESGTYEVRVADTDAALSNGGGEVVHVYQTLEHVKPSFGELALIESRQRAASVVATEDGALWALDRAAFRAVFFGAVQSGILEALRRVPELQGLKFSQLRDLASKMEERPRVWQAGEAVVEPEQAGFYMVRQGTAEVRDEAGQALQTLRELDYVGESTLAGGSKFVNRVVVTSSPCVLLSLSPRDVEEALGKKLQAVEESDFSRRRKRFNSRGGEVAIPSAASELEMVGLVHEDDLGGGTFLVSWREPGSEDPTLFTLRSVSKSAVVASGKQALLLRRAEVSKLLSCGKASPFIPHLLRTMREESALHELYEGKLVAPVRELIRSRPSGTMLEPELRHVAACVVSLLLELHQAHVIFRGVCPELLFLDSFGYIVTTDFRFSKLGVERTFTLCGGRPGYVAPEQVSHAGHTQAVDFWALGVLLWELTTGQALFGGEGQDDVATYRSISEFSPASLKLPDGVSTDLRGFLQGLLTPDPDARLGAKGGASELKSHAWLASVGFEGLEAGRRDNPLTSMVHGYLRELQQRRDVADGVWGKVHTALTTADDSLFSGF